MKKVINKRYEVIGILGRGGMSRVYKVADRFQRRTILAVKELRLVKQAQGKAREAIIQFQTEARILKCLTHPNLPKVYDYFYRQGAYYIVMEYIRGRTLEHLLEARRGKPLDERLVLSWALQVCRAIHFLSVQKPRPIVLRDLKPSNIMIDRGGRIKLIDFGIARYFKDDKSEDTFIYGTPGYAAPEQYGTGQTDVRSDIFSLGATMHHCVTGRNPSQNPLAFSDPHLINPKLSRATGAIINKALEPDMNKRFQNAHEMKIAVQKAQLDLSVPIKVGRSIIYAKPGKAILLPWWRRSAWVSVPVMSLGCSGSTGTLSSKDHWIKPKPKSFGPDAAQLLFHIENSMLKYGWEYRPHIIVKTDEGILYPRLIFKKRWPWIILEIAAVAAVIVYIAMMR